MKQLLLGSLLLCSLLRADFQPSNWKYRRPLPVNAAAPLAGLTLDRGTYIHSQPGLGDLRVTREQNGASAEVPYVLEKLSGTHKHFELSNATFDQGVTSAGNLEVTVDVGAGQRHNAIRLSTPRLNFRQRVGVTTSDDARSWTRVRDDGYIFDFSQDASHVTALEVPYARSTRRYVRLTVYGWNDPKAVSQAWVSLEEDQPPVRDAMASWQPQPVPDPKTQSTLYTWDLGVAGIPHDELTLEVDTPAFERAAVVESSADGKEWSSLGQGVLWRFAKEQSLTLDFLESHQRFFRLRVYNRDDQPLAVKTATLSVIRAGVKFKTGAGGSYWLHFGNANANAPSYDLRDVLAREAPLAEAAIAPGPEEPNPAYREPPPPTRPWSEQHPEILYLTLALAVAGMGFVTVRFLKKVNAENR